MFRRRTGRPPDTDPVLRALVVAAVLRNPIVDVSDPEAVSRMRDGQDVSFDELGLDSLARLTIAVDLNDEGFPIAEQEVDEAGTVDGLTRLLGRFPTIGDGG